MSMRAALFSIAICAACAGTPTVKPSALDPAVLARAPLPSDLLEGERDELRLREDLAWMSDVRPSENLVFAGLRGTDGSKAYVRVIELDPAADRLVVRPLPPGVGPLAYAGEPLGEKHILSLSQVIEERLLGNPLPAPRHVYAVGANYPTHLSVDLATKWNEERRASLAAARPRVFLKYPATAPLGFQDAEDLGYAGLHGPFDGIEYPATISLPDEEQEDGRDEIPLRLDYEVEVGVVLGRDLTWEDVRDNDDAVIRSAIAGYVLVSDAKARNPQVLHRVRHVDDEPPPASEPYEPDDEDLALELDFWDAETCAWWSYAASFGNFTAIGPFFVAADSPGLPPRAMLTARSYATADVRGMNRPGGREADVLYLRQCSLTTEDPSHDDGLIWTVPEIVRSILTPNSVIPEPDAGPRLARGDVISLGTPGGTVTTARKGFRFLRHVLFWWAPRDWHDKFFERDAPLYLRNGDRVFYWAEGLGYQAHTVEER